MDSDWPQSLLWSLKLEVSTFRHFAFNTQQLARTFVDIHPLFRLPDPDPPNELSVLSSRPLPGLLIAPSLWSFFTTPADRFDETLNEDRHPETLKALVTIILGASQVPLGA